MDAFSSAYRESVVVFKSYLANALAEIKWLTTQLTLDKDLLDGVRTAATLRMTASQQRAPSDANDSETLLADTTAVVNELGKFSEDIQAKIDSMQVSLDDVVKRINALYSERVKLFVYENSLKRQIQERSDRSHELEDLKCRLDRAIANRRWSETIIKVFQEQLLTLRSDVDKYRRRLPLHTERFTAYVTDDLSVFLYSFGTDVKKLVEKRRKEIETTVKADLEAIEAFLSSLNSKLSRPGSSS